MLSRLRPLFLFSLPLILAACSGDGERVDPTTTLEPLQPTATAEVPPPAPAAVAAALEPDGERIKSLVHQLSVNVGTRATGAGSGEREGANLLATLLRGYGYEVELQEFTASRETSRESKISITAPAARAVASNPFSSSAATTAKGALLGAGIGRPEEIPAQARGAILLIERGDLTFQQKVDNAQAAGAAGIIIFNNEGGNFFGTFSSLSSIPAVSITQAEGQALRAELQRSLQVEISVGEAPITSSQNVIAKPPGKQCETITGGHYDSVPQAPGANDNASGTATVVEIAAVLASQGKMGSNCFVLFGAEELGLLGSKAYVEKLSAEERGRIRAMLNFDMVGFGAEPWYLIGTASMQTRATAVARDLGIETQTRGSASTDSGSDHASFMEAGIPSVFFYRSNDPQWHQPGDTADRLSPVLLEEAARMGVAMLEALRAG